MTSIQSGPIQKDLDTPKLTRTRSESSVISSKSVKAPLPKTPPLSRSLSSPVLGSTQDEQDIDQMIDKTPIPQKQHNESLVPDQVTESIMGKVKISEGLTKTVIDTGLSYGVSHSVDLSEQGLGTEDGGMVDKVDVGFALVQNDNGTVGRFRLGGSNLANTGLSGVLSGGFGILKDDKYLSDGRLLQVRAKRGDLTVGVSSKVGGDSGVPVSGSIGVEGAYDIAYARKLQQDQSLMTVKDEEPPSKSALSKDPLILNPGDEIAYRGMMKLSLSAGAVEPHSHVKFSVGGSIEKEFVTSVKRLSGHPPKFKVHIEPGNRNVDVHGSVGWGPFTVTGGGSYASTVHYNFEMSEPALKQFLKTGELPKLPDPKIYLSSMDKLSDKKKAKLLRVFDHVENGVRITSMGATKSYEGYIEGSATVGKAKLTSGKSKAVFIGDGEVIRQDIRTMTSSHSAWFVGELSQSLSLTQGDRYTLDSKKDFVKEYTGLEASYEIGDTKTSRSDLRKRVELANSLIGSVKSESGVLEPPLHLPSPTSKSWGSSSLQVSAKITPEILQELTVLGGIVEERQGMSEHELRTRKVSGDRPDPLTTIDFMGHEHGVSKSDIKEMLLDLKSISEDPELAGNTDEIRRLQGVRVAAFLGTSTGVDEGELKRIATIQRLVGPEHKVVDVEFSTDVHMKKINGLKLDSYLDKVERSGLSEVRDTLKSVTGSTPDERGSWTHFNAGAQKLKALEQIRENLVNDKNIDPEEKAGMLRMVDEYLDALDVELSAQLDDPRGRKKIMEGLLSAGPILPDELKRVYKSPETMYQDPDIREEFMDMVLQASVRDIDLENPEPDEMISLIRSIARSDNGHMGIDEAFKLLNFAAEVSPEFLSDVIDGVGINKFKEMLPRMSDDQKIKTKAFFEGTSASTEINKALDKLDKKGLETFTEFGKELSSLEDKLGKLRLKQMKMTRSDSSSKPPTRTDMMEHFKSGHKDLERPLSKLEEKISDSIYLLGEERHQTLSKRVASLEKGINSLLDGTSRLSSDQRLDLMDKLLEQRTMGPVSHLIIQRMVGMSDDSGELAAFAHKLQSRISHEDSRSTRVELQSRLAELQAHQELLLG